MDPETVLPEEGQDFEQGGVRFSARNMKNNSNMTYDVAIRSARGLRFCLLWKQNFVEYFVRIIYNKAFVGVLYIDDSGGLVELNASEPTLSESQAVAKPSVVDTS